jgi:dipeptide/tripeptide permease
MRTAVLIGALLLIVGIVALSYQGVIWFTGTERVAKIGPVEVNQEKSYPVPILPIVGGIAVVAGAVVLLRSRPT